MEIASQRVDSHRGEDRKVNVVVNELKRYGVKVAALQEMKWFGSEMYQVSGSVVLTAGQKMPAEGERVVRGEGVALVLSGPAVEVWKRVGSQWTACSSRAVSTCLQVGKGAAGRLHVMSCFPPTRAARREDKMPFPRDRELSFDSASRGEVCVDGRLQCPCWVKGICGGFVGWSERPTWVWSGQRCGEGTSLLSLSLSSHCVQQMVHEE